MRVNAGAKEQQGEYKHSIILRFFLLFLLWLLYNLVPYTIPAAWLYLVTIMLLLYDCRYWMAGEKSMGVLILVAAILNTVMATMISKPLNTVLALFVFVILLFDIVSVPQKSGRKLFRKPKWLGN